MPISKAKMRERKRLERVVVNPKSILNVTPEALQTYVTPYPPILYALTDPVKRIKIERVYQSLKEHKVTERVFYGYPGLGGIPFDMIGGYLEATR